MTTVDTWAARLSQQDPRAGQLLFDSLAEQGRKRRDLEQGLGAGIFMLVLVSGLVIALASSAAAGVGVVGVALVSGLLIHVLAGRP